MPIKVSSVDRIFSKVADEDTLFKYEVYLIYCVKVWNNRRRYFQKHSKNIFTVRIVEL